MNDVFLLVQLSDLHIGGTWGRGDPVANLAAVVKAIGSLQRAPDALVISGDLADHGADAEYEQVRELLDPLAVPTYVLPGNHDDRDALHRHFDAPFASSEFVQYAVDLGPLRLVALDTQRPGDDSGELDAERLAWLDAALADVPHAPTILAMHHPPLMTGIWGWDEFALAPADQSALGEVVERHRQVIRMIAGHVHRPMSTEFRGRGLQTAPSTYVQARLSFSSDEFDLTDEPPGFAVHALRGGDLVSYVQLVS